MKRIVPDQVGSQPGGARARPRFNKATILTSTRCCCGCTPRLSAAGAVHRPRPIAAAVAHRGPPPGLADRVERPVDCARRLGSSLSSSIHDLPPWCARGIQGWTCSVRGRFAVAERSPVVWPNLPPAFVHRAALPVRATGDTPVRGYHPVC